MTADPSGRVGDRVFHQVSQRGGELAVAAVDGQPSRARPRPARCPWPWRRCGCGPRRRRPPSPPRPARGRAAAPRPAAGKAPCSSVTSWPRRALSRWMRSAKRRLAATSVAGSAPEASGSVASSRPSASSCSAPIGVFSSWLTLATKSRRTRSTRWASVTSAASMQTIPPPMATARRCTPSGLTDPRQIHLHLAPHARVANLAGQACAARDGRRRCRAGCQPAAAPWRGRRGWPSRPDRRRRAGRLRPAASRGSCAPARPSGRAPAAPRQPSHYASPTSRCDRRSHSSPGVPPE